MSKHRGPEKMGRILTRLMARRGFLRQISSEALEQAWGEAVGALLAENSRLGALKRGVLEVFVAHAIIAQELSFRQAELVPMLNSVSGDNKIKRLKFTVWDNRVK